ncbi:MAG: hypothetical protein M3256_01430 [Actinomycetota bacterium]|nr:hypothetical protein [Actinomycetota bacterium]
MTKWLPPKRGGYQPKDNEDKHPERPSAPPPAPSGRGPVARADNAGEPKVSKE